GMTLINQADVVLALGTRLGPFGTLPQYEFDYWPTNAKIIQVDADQKMLGLVKKIDVGICGDAKAVAEDLLARLNDREVACDATKDQRAGLIKAEKMRGRPSSIPGLMRRTSSPSTPSMRRRRRTATGCTRVRCCASSRRRCPPTSWSPPT